MFKILIFLFCVFSLSSAGIFDIIISLTLKKNEFPIKVRTIEERDRIWMNKKYAVLDFIGLVEQYDAYKAEEYNITTDDGYILGLHRIIASPKSPQAEGKPVVFLQHGLFGSSDYMVVLGPRQALAYQLADAGYDVWLGNIRGNTYSRSHVEYKPSDSAFWNFRMDEIGVHDISKFIDLALEKSGQKKLTFIGYSMGTTLSYILLSSKPEYNEKINLLVSIAPVAYFTPPTNDFINKLISTVLTVNKLSNEIYPQSVAIGNYGRELCSDTGTSNICKDLLSSFVDIQNINISAIPSILEHIPAGTSYNTLEHFQQLINSDGKFRKFDYPCGFWHPSCLNKKKYDQSTAPEYDVSLITVPNVIFYSNDDTFVKVQGVNILKDKLPNVIALEGIFDKKFNHLDFGLSMKARELVYNRVLDIMSKNL